MWAEIARIHPEAIVCLGATAARAVIGKQHQLLRQRGEFVEHPSARLVTATVHPSSILRAPDAERRSADYEAFVKDLAGVAKALGIVKRAA
jgi:DNA polymerase